MEEKKFITVEEAKALSEKPSRLINVIFRNIKEEAEMGLTNYTYSAESLSESAQKFVVNNLRAKGFKVHDVVSMINFELCAETEEKDAEVEKVRLVTFFISW